MSGNAWLMRFLDQPHCKILIRVDDEFLHNSFNITGAKQQLPHFAQAYELLRRGTIPSSDGDYSVIEREAEILYFVLHLRFLLTRTGMQLLFEKFQQKLFQQCPRINCRGAQCLPYGVAEEFGRYPVKMYCPGCSDLYSATDADLERLDGSAFGPSWVHMFLQKYPQVIPPGPNKVYVPKIFGFRIAQPELGYQESDDEDED
jgi:casein kinase II subunit beta